MRSIVLTILSFVLFACEAPPPQPNFGKRLEQQPLQPETRKSATGGTNDRADLERRLAALAQAQKAKAQQGNTPPPRPDQPVRAALQRRPSTPDPMNGKFTLKQALKGLPGKGKLTATLKTSMGDLKCKLYDDKAPFTVANFVGLARGKRPFWHAMKRQWVSEPLFDGTTFHRVIPGFMIQGGDHLGDGTGDVGYNLKDELHPTLKHDRAGLLCMANKGPNTNGGQFFITDAPAPHLTAAGTYSIFGECSPTTVVSQIARVPRGGRAGTRPTKDVLIEKVTIARR